MSLFNGNNNNTGIKLNLSIKNIWKHFTPNLYTNISCYKYDRGLIYLLYQEITTNKKNINEQRAWTDTSPRRKNKWLRHIMDCNVSYIVYTQISIYILNI